MMIMVRANTLCDMCDEKVSPNTNQGDDHHLCGQSGFELVSLLAGVYICGGKLGKLRYLL